MSTPMEMLLQGGGQAADVRLLGALGWLEQNIAQLAGEGIGDGWTLLQRLAGDAQLAQRVFGLLPADRFGGSALLATLWQQLLQQLRGRIPDAYRALGYTLSELARQKEAARSVDWQLCSVDQGLTLAAGSLGLKMGASATFTAAATLPDALEVRAGADRVALRISLSGTLDGSAEAATTPGTQLAASLAAAASGAEDFDFYFLDQRSGLFATLLAEDLAELRNPLELAGVAAMFARDRFAGAVLRCERGLTLDGKLNLAATLPTGAAVSLDAQVQVGFSLQDKVGFSCSVARGEGGRLRIALKRDVSHAHDSQRALSVGIDLAGWFSRYGGLFVGQLGELRSLLETVDKRLPGPTFIADALQGLEAKLPADLSGLFAPKLDAAGVRTLLAERLLEAIQGSAATWASDPQTAADEVLTRLSALLPGLESSASTLRPVVVQALTRLDDGLRQAVEAVLKQGHGPALEQALAVLGDRVDAAGAGLQRQIDLYTAGLRRQLARWQSTLAKITEAFSVAARQRVEAKFTTETSHVESAGADLVVLLDSQAEAAQGVWQRLLTGEVAPLLEGNGTPFPGVSVSGRLWQQWRESRSRGYELVLFGLQLGESSLFDSSVHYEVDAHGMVHVLAKAAWEGRRRLLKETRLIDFASTLELASAGLGTSASLSLGVSQSDQDMQPEEIRAFFGSMEENDLLPKGSGAHAASAAIDYRAAHPASFKRGTMEVALLLNGAQLEQLLQRVDDDTVLNVAAQAVAACTQREPSNRELLKKADEIRRFAGLGGSLEAAIVGMDEERRRYVNDHLGELAEEMLLAGDYGNAAYWLWARQHGALSLAAALRAAREAYASGMQGVPAWSYERHRRVQQQMATDLGEWWRQSQDRLWQFFNDDEVRPITMALFASLCRLATAVAGQPPVIDSRLQLSDGGSGKSVKLI